MRIRSLLFAFAGFIVFIIAVLVVSTDFLLHNASRQLNEDVARSIAVRDAMAEVRFHVAEVQQFLTDSAATGEQDGADDAHKHVLEAQQQLALMVRLDPRQAEAARVVEQKLLSLENTGLRMVAAYRTSREAGNAIMKAGDGFDNSSDALVNELAALEQRVVAERALQQSSISARLRHVTWVVAIGGAIVMVATIGAVVVLRRRLFAALGAEPVETMDLAGQMAQGNLACSVQAAPHSVLGRLEAMRLRWVALIGDLRSDAHVVAATTVQLSERADALAANSVAQSEATAAIAANVEQMSVSIVSLSEQSANASHEVLATGKVAESSADLIARVAAEIGQLATMVTQSAEQIRDLDRRAQDIESIVTVIGEIAAQTNLLALNAAIEAARAGETGRGFAVVADEVRKLAERTATSTVSIRDMIGQVHQATGSIVTTIDQGVAGVVAGVELTEQATAAMERIREAALQAGRSVEAINLALAEQRANSHDVAVKVERISLVTSANSELAQEMASAAHDLQSVADRVENGVSWFRC